MCRGPGTGDFVEYVLMPSSDLCLSSKEAGVNEEGSTVNDDPCLTVDDNQRWYIYRDAPNSNAIGLQVKRNGFMLGQLRVVDWAPMRLYSSGVPAGAGTYFLERIP